MKNIFFSLLALAFCINNVNAQELIEKRFDVAKGEELDIDLEIGGSIEIEGWDRNEVYIKARNQRGDWDEYEVDMRKRSKSVIVEVYEKRGSYWRDRGRRRNRITFEIKVPKEFELRMESMGGDIRISGVEGEMRGKTMGGGIHLENLKGRVNLSTMGGAITVRDSELDGSVSTMGGRVLVEDVIGDLKASSMGGHVEHRNVKDRRGRSSGKEVRIKTMGGPIRVSDAPQGANLNTMGGDVRVRSAKDHVVAETMGGNIDVDELDGWIEAITYSGDINVKIVGDPNANDKHVELESYSGDVELIVPENLSMDVEIEIEYTRRSRGRYKIVTDFDLKIEESQEWERSRRRGSDRRDRWGIDQDTKVITGTGNLKGGKNRILIRTINGNVYLKKGN